MRQRWLDYRRVGLTDDLVAAVIVTILLVTQSLSYALLTGLSPIVGVMAGQLPIVAYAALGSCSTLAVGPVAVLALMTAQTIGPVAQAQGVGAHLAAMVLVLEMAAVFLLAARLRLDVFAALLSATVLHGFITGAAIGIAISQLPQLLGVAVKGNNLTGLLSSLLKAESVQPHAGTAAIGLAALLALWSICRFGTRLAATYVGVRERLFPTLTLACTAWLGGDTGVALVTASRTGAVHFHALAVQILLLHRQWGQQVGPAIDRLLTGALAVCSVLTMRVST